MQGSNIGHLRVENIGPNLHAAKEIYLIQYGASCIRNLNSLVVTPYYVKPTQKGLVKHFTYLADAVDLPIVLYNVPGRTGVDLKPETVGLVASHKGIVGKSGL